MAFSFQRLWSATMTAYKAFQQAYAASDQANDKFASWDARKLRYSLLWAMYENTAYDQVHAWAESYKSQYGLYQAIRNIYNPSYRLGEFWKSHLLGGMLDPLAGDGQAKPSAIPIATKNEKLRPAIAKVWQWSNWQIKKDIFCLWTPVLGDGIIKVEDDPERGKVYLNVVHPSKLKEIDLDDFGNVKGYILEYQEDDPRPGRAGNKVAYREVVSRDGNDVVYQTYLNDGLYAWNENQGDTWSVEYGFVPLIFQKHNDVGLDFGWSEFFPGLSKFREVDDQASKLHDQIRKMVEGAWLLAGVQDPKKTIVAQGRSATQSDEEKAKNPQPVREEMKVIFSNNADAKAHSLVAPLNIGEATANIQSILQELERDYPELRVDLANVSGDISGRALRINRGPAESKVLQRRPNYDNALVRAHQMAVAIGGWRKYAGFEGFDLGSYDAGELEHSIAERPVFDTDPMDKLEEDGAFWENSKKAKDSGVPLTVYLELNGWPKDKIAKVINSPEYQMRMQSMELALEGQRAAQQGDVFPVKKTNRDDEK